MKISLLVLWSIIIALNIYDSLTTIIILENGGTEVNPIINWVIGKYGAGVGLLIPKAITIIFLTCVTGCIVGKKFLNIRQRITIITSYLIAICYYSYIMYNYNYAYMKLVGS